MGGVKLSKKQKECLELMYNIFLKNNEEGCMATHLMNGRLRDALVKKGLAEYSSGYGFKHGGIVVITELGKEEAKKIMKVKEG